jgi:uncharacterized membrane protein
MRLADKFNPAPKPESGAPPADLKAGLQRLAHESDSIPLRIGARLRNYFLTGLIIVGPVTITLYIILWLVNVVDAWMKPFVPDAYNPGYWIGHELPGVGLLFAIAALIVVGALAANLIGRSLISFGDMMLDRMPIVRNVYRAMKQIFESVVSATGPSQAFQKVGLVEFPSKGLWSLVFVTGDVTGEISAVKPGGESDLVSVFMPTGIVPPTGFVCFIPRREVRFIDMTVEDAAKVIISGGMVQPDYQAKLKELAEKARGEAARAALENSGKATDSPG